MTDRAEWDRLAERLRVARSGRDADGTLLHLHDTCSGADEVRLVCGGQLGIFRRDALVPLDAALAAMTDHLAGRTGGRGPEWGRTPDS
ncbi:hypothetical protein [Nocardiopsis sp. CC223A]|uniref:hypothetical protein n=1 Tax=Nocardiopsis sp. CC223A TaxID=3044051 RepID=UPI002795424B|nr:hypothetical protein [Nocardiopsis sp. CC223A]